MNNRKQRANIARETIEILERGNYQNLSGELINLSGVIADAKARSIYYDSFDRVFKDLNLLAQNLPPQKIEFSVVNQTTLHQ